MEHRAGYIRLNGASCRLAMRPGAIIRTLERSDVATNDAKVIPKATMVAPVKPEPLMMTVVPPVKGPELGRTPVTVGGV